MYKILNLIKKTNILANNSSERQKKNANPFISDVKIRELELSITNKCNLTCRGCGFNVPHQIKPVIGTGIDEHILSLIHLKNTGIKIGKIILVGGEVTLEKNLFEYIIKIKDIGISDEIELVTNGLYPKGVTKKILNNLDSFVISDYVVTDRFERLWYQYLSSLEYKGTIEFRRKTAWDDLLSEVINDQEKTKEHWLTCFYRKYDVTLERGRIFSCSRIAKKNWDEQGLLINSDTSISSIIDYLTTNTPRKACYSCAIIGNESQLPVADQTRNNIKVIISRAEKYMEEYI